MAVVCAISQCTIIWRLRMWSSSIVVPSRIAAQLDQRIARVATSYSASTISVWCSAGSRPTSAIFGSGRKYSATRSARASSIAGVLLLERQLRLAIEVLGDAARSVSQHFVDRRRHLAGERAPALGARDFFLRPAELAPVRRQLRLVVRLVDVGERHRLAAVTLANPLIVRQVDADGRHRPRLAGLDDDVDGARGDADDIGAPPAADPTASAPRTTAAASASRCRLSVFSWFT